MRTMGLFAGVCVDVTVMHFALRLLVACLTADNKQVLIATYIAICSLSVKNNLFKS